MMSRHPIAGRDARKGLAMRHARGELSTNMVDLTDVSLAELRGCEDPALRRSLVLVVGRMECSRTGVLQNEVPDER
jgi:FXSXX-COOH protein